MKRTLMVYATGVAASVIMSSLAFGQADWTQRSPTHVPPKRMNTAIAQFGDGSQVVMFGGLNLGGPGVFSEFNVLGDTWLWNGTDWTQFTPASSPPPRYGSTMAWDPATGNAVLFGGRDANGFFLRDTWVFNRHSTCSTKLGCFFFFSWTQVTFAAGAALPPARSDAAMAVKPGSPPSLIALTGGTTRSGLSLVFLNDTWIFDTSTNTWTQSISGPPARAYAAMAPCLGSGLGTAMLFGGFNGFFTAPLGDTWVYNFDLPAWFGPNLPQTAPAPRFGQGMAHYPVSGFRVLYGGQAFNAATSTSVLPTDTWNGTCNPAPSTWSNPGGLVTPAHNPGPRMFHGMTTGPSGFTVLLFGGDDLPFPRSGGTSFPNGRDRNDTWTWGRRVACLPGDGSELSVGTAVDCQFDQTEGVQFQGWSADGFAPPSRDQLTTTFHTKGPGSASITAQWTDTAGSHTQSFRYTIDMPNH